MLPTNFIRSASYEALPNRRLFPAKVVDTRRFLFYAILENMEITKAETMDYYVVVAVLRSERFGKGQAVEDVPIFSATLPERWGIR